jgi:hypothetical protein
MRPLYRYYPRELEGKLYVPRDHGIRSEGFKPIKNGKYMYSIHSKFVEDGNRRYFLEFSDVDNLDSERLVPSFFKGLIGESLMRIVVMEFMRTQSKNLSFNNFYFIKQKNGSTVFLKNDTYSLEFFDKYNIRFILNSNKTISEFDGLMEYRVGREKGVILCESKTGRLGMYDNPELNEKEIFRKIILPLNVFYPSHHRDFLFMTHEVNIVQKDRQLKGNLVTLKHLLDENNVGFIPFSFPDSKETISNIGKNMASLNKRLRKDQKTLDRKINYPEHEAIVKGNAIYIIKKGRVEMILEKIGDRNYTTLFRR